MKPELQRIAIATACGWKWFEHPDVIAATRTFTLPNKWVLNPNGRLVFPHDAPDYLADLNAMAKVEKVLHGPIQRGAFSWRLTELCNPEDRCHATAAQHAEAFLRCISKWEDSK